MRRLASCVASVTAIVLATLVVSSTAGANPATFAANVESAGVSPVTAAGFGCKIIDRKLICGKDIDDDDDDNDGGAQKQENKKQEDKKKKQGNICAGEVACPPGYVVLDKPNKYGACCEPKEGLPAPATTEKCKFPGEVGTPPNCHCPSGTEFVGYKGCVAVEMKETCVVYAYGQTQEERNRLDSEWAKIRASCPKDATQAGCTGGISPNSASTCCCKYKVYAK